MLKSKFLKLTLKSLEFQFQTIQNLNFTMNQIRKMKQFQEIIQINYSLKTKDLEAFLLAKDALIHFRPNSSQTQLWKSWSKPRLRFKDKSQEQWVV